MSLPPALVARDHWESRWEKGPQPRIRLANYYHWLIHRELAPLAHEAQTVLEVGCGGSAWLPFLANRYGLEAWGLDYSEAGLRATQTSLDRERVRATLVLGDLLDPPESLSTRCFDLVYSMGVIEHFSDPAMAIRSMAAMLGADARIFTLVPNMNGLVGRMHRAADPVLYASHIRFTPAMLDETHEAAGLGIAQPAHYAGTLSLAVVDYETILARLPEAMRRVVAIIPRVAQQALVAPLRLAHLRLENASTSPWIVGTYRTGEAGRG